MSTTTGCDCAGMRLVGSSLVVSGGFAPGDEKRLANALLVLPSRGYKACEIDLSGCDRISKPGVKAVLTFVRIAERSRRTVAVRASGQVAREFRLAGFDVDERSTPPSVKPWKPRRSLNRFFNCTDWMDSVIP